MIPVTQSRSAAQAQTQMANDGNYDYRTHFLIGRKSDNGNSVVIAKWPHLPTKADMDAAIANAKNDYTQFALTTPTNFWSK